jgi:mannose-6-phosphate isomerase-like protein (cupin superfamily)
LSNRWRIKELPEKYDDIAADGSEIRLLLATEKASLVHCTLSPMRTSAATRNEKIDEIWYFIGGQGEIWFREERDKGDGTTKEVRPGTCLTIPADVRFQFRATGEDPLTFLCVTMPPWPGKHANVEVEPHWSPS